jgi:hypothetical protein
VRSVMCNHTLTGGFLFLLILLLFLYGVVKSLFYGFCSIPLVRGFYIVSGSFRLGLVKVHGLFMGFR